jgi:hypothetical protein
MLMFSKKSLALLALTTFLLNVLIHVFIRSFDINLFGPQSGNDADFYHNYAVGSVNFFYSGWAEILRVLESLGIYNRLLLTTFIYILYLLSLIYVFHRFFSVNSQLTKSAEKKAKFLAYIYFFSYPNLIYLSTDIYRDLLMLVIFLYLAVYIRNFPTVNHSRGVFFKVLCVFLGGGVLYYLRPYLGFSFLVSFVFVYFYFPRIYGFKLLAYLLFYFILLLGLFLYGFLDRIIAFRGESGFDYGASSFGLSLMGQDAIGFFKSFFISFMYQVFGFYYSGFRSITIMVFETIPFLYALIYLLRNRRYIDRFGTWLLVFSLLYSTIFVLGNDNLGTASRLRIFIYVSIFVAALRIYLLKLHNILSLDER